MIVLCLHSLPQCLSSFYALPSLVWCLFPCPKGRSDCDITVSSGMPLWVEAGVKVSLFSSTFVSFSHRHVHISAFLICCAMSSYSVFLNCIKPASAPALCVVSCECVWHHCKDSHVYTNRKSTGYWNHHFFFFFYPHFLAAFAQKRNESLPFAGTHRFGLTVLSSGIINKTEFVIEEVETSERF